MIYTTGITVFILSLVGGIISLVTRQPLPGAWAGIVCHLGFILLVIDGLTPKKGYMPHATRDHSRFDMFDAVLSVVFCAFFGCGFWGFVTSRDELYTMTNHSEVLTTIAIIGWLAELLYCFWVLIDFMRDRLKRVAY